MGNQLYEGDGPFAPRESAPGLTGRNVCPARIDNHKHTENKLKVTLPPDIHYNIHQKPLTMEINPSVQEVTPPKQKHSCTFCRYHWCSVPHCPHTCIHQIDASDKQKPTCAGHWFIQLKPGESSLCPGHACRAESNEDQYIQTDKTCIYDEPCKADCYDHPPGIKPHKYPLGYPNREEC